VTYSCVVDALHLVLLGAAALAAGAVNAIAGGGSLISFPALLALGIPAVTASMTNTVAMCPGYFGAMVAQRRDLVGQRTRAWHLVPLSIMGSVAGAWILMHTSERSFRVLVPFLLLFAGILLALQPRLRARLARHTGGHSVALALVPVGLCAVYGAYFGAGLGMMILAVLGVVVDDTLIRMNALKQLLTLVINVVAAIVFLVFGTIAWQAALVVAIASLVGGYIGGAIASRVPETLLRGIVVAVALTASAIYFARL
jgi:uncharacterized membrane protein YfcA